MPNSSIDSDTLDLEHLKQEFNRFRSELGDRLGQNATQALAQMSAYLEGGNLASRVTAMIEKFRRCAFASGIQGAGDNTLTPDAQRRRSRDPALWRTRRRSA